MLGSYVGEIYLLYIHFIYTLNLFVFFFSICRKAISRSGLQHLAPVHTLNIPVTNGPVKEPRAALEWTVGVWFFGS